MIFKSDKGMNIFFNFCSMITIQMETYSTTIKNCARTNLMMSKWIVYYVFHAPTQKIWSVPGAPQMDVELIYQRAGVRAAALHNHLVRAGESET